MLIYKNKKGQTSGFFFPLVLLQKGEQSSTAVDAKCAYFAVLPWSNVQLLIL